MALSAWHRSAFAFIERSGWPQGLHLMQGLRPKGLEPTVVSYTVGVRAYGSMTYWRCCQLLLQGLEVDVMARMALLLAFKGQWRRAAGLLTAGDEVLRSAVVSSFARAKMWQKALEGGEKDVVGCSVPWLLHLSL